jgi:predicted secreted Zn-dependent protease
VTYVRLASLSAVAIAVVAIVGACAPTQPETPDASVAIAVPASAPVSAEPTASPTPRSTAVPTPVPTPTPAATAAPVATPTPDPATALVALPKLSTSIPGASKISYFKVTGDSPSEIVDHIVAKSAKPCLSGSRDVLACVTWKGGGYRWTNTTNPYTGSCTVTTLTIVKPNSTVHLPQLVGQAKVEPALLAWWKPVLDHFAWHEGKHIRIEQKFEKKLRPLVVGHRCSSARAIIRRWERNMAAAQHRFDVSDYHWQPESSVPYTGSQR